MFKFKNKFLNLFLIHQYKIEQCHIISCLFLAGRPLSLSPVERNFSETAKLFQVVFAQQG
jgi:hypothetical protein